ncbi:MAG TPA: hypothetical protein ENI14_02235 [Thermoplasmatales archaeon]|nr:hypothetical protein [Thermoplasmatales archaeon]
MIYFSHSYDKLKYENGRLCLSAKLIEAIPVNLQDLSNEFLEYDTEGLFRLPKKGKYIMLLFFKRKGNIFPTLRPYTEERYKYYKSNVGRVFDIIYLTVTTRRK